MAGIRYSVSNKNDLGNELSGPAFSVVKNWVLNQLGGFLTKSGLSSTTVTSAYTVLPSDTVIVCNNGSPMTLTLPEALGRGKWYIIKNIGAGAVTLDGKGAETIDGAANQTIVQWGAYQIIDYTPGAWVIIGENVP